MAHRAGIDGCIHVDRGTLLGYLQARCLIMTSCELATSGCSYEAPSARVAKVSE